MKTTVIGGWDKGAAAELARSITEGVSDGENTADLWLLPAGITSFCTDCGLCYDGQPTKCRHAREVMPILKSMISSDIVVFVTPELSGHTTAPVLNFLGYLAYLQIGCRPEPSMLVKRAVVISLGAKRAAEDIADCVRLWGISDVRVLTRASAASAARLALAPPKKPGFFARLRMKRIAKKAGLPLPRICGGK